MLLANLKNGLSKRTIGTLLAGALLAAAFVAVFIVPDYRAARLLREDIQKLQASLDTRRQFLPVVLALKKAREGLPTVEAQGGGGWLPLGDVGHLNTILGDMATSLGLRVTRVSPDPASVKNGLLAVRLGLSGEPGAFRELLLTLGRYAPLVKVESVFSSIGRDEREYAVKCWLAVK